jgi:photosystem II stability/assembly factor-like uncharacterized protein
MSFISKNAAAFCLSCLITVGAHAQWSSVSSGTTANLQGISVLDSGIGYAVGDGGTILKSIDAGETWDALTSGTTKALYDVYFFSETEGLVVGDSGTILRTTDGGATWLSVSSGVRDGLRSVSFNGANGICGGLAQDILYSSDSGATWHVAQDGFFGGGFFGAHMLSPTVGFVTGQNSIFQGMQGTTVDGGVHWSFHTFYFDGNEGNADDSFFFDDLTGVTSGVLFDGTGALARTSDGGTSWDSTLFSNGMQGIDFPKPETGYAVGFLGTILKSSDLGATWSAQTSGTFADLYDVRFMSDGLTGLAVGAIGTILRTTNGGQAGGLELLSAVSRKGGFDIDLPLTGPIGIECRSGGADGAYKLLLTFNNSLTSIDAITASCGTVDSSAIDNADPHQLRISLTGLTCNAETVAVALSGIQDDQGNTLASAEVSAGLLLGDVNGDSVVDNADAEQLRSDRREATDSSNYREDLNTNGRIDAADFRTLKSNLGTILPP